MSGFEIVGLILTSYPVLKAALTLYNDTKSGKGAQRLVRNLKTEEAIFNNFVLRLLKPPIISEAEFARLTNPGRPDLKLWKDRKLQGKLETRLGREKASISVEILGEIQEELLWLHNELKFSDHGLVKNLTEIDCSL